MTINENPIDEAARIAAHRAALDDARLLRADAFRVAAEQLAHIEHRTMPEILGVAEWIAGDFTVVEND